jgi:hypothetical protein
MVPERQKMQWFHHVQENVDVVFLGSSHVYRQFDPTLFDQLRGADQRDLRSVNMGALGMGLNEESFLLRQILADRPPHLQWIVIEALPYDLEFQNANDFGLRRLEWHDSALTFPLLWAIWRSELPAAEKYPLMKRHFEHWWRRSLNLARGLDVVDHQLEAPFSLANRPNLGANQDGYMFLEMATATPQSRGMHAKFLRDPSRLLQAARDLPLLPSGGQPDQNLRDLVLAMEQQAALQGVGIIWWLHPNLERYVGWRQMKIDGDIRYLIAHDAPKRFPQFYQKKWRFDLFHLNRKGSQLLTKLFASEFEEITAAAEGQEK